MEGRTTKTTAADEQSLFEGIPPWIGATARQLARLAGLSAVVFASAYLVGLAHLASYFGAAGISYEVVRQDPIAIAASVYFLILPAFLIWNWRSPTITAMLRGPRSRSVIIGGIAILAIDVLLIAWYWMQSQFDWVAVLLSANMIVGYYGLMQRAEWQRRLLLLALVVFGAAGLLGWGSAEDLKHGTYSKPLALVSTDVGVPGLAQTESEANVYGPVIVFYQDLDRLYVLSPVGDEHVVAIPLTHVTSIETWRGQVSVSGPQPSAGPSATGALMRR